MRKLKEAYSFFLRINQLQFVRKFTYLISDRGVQLLSQLFNIFVLAKYLSAGYFGILLYSLSIYGLLLGISNVGLDRILVIEFSQKSNERNIAQLMVSGLLIKIIVSASILFILLIERSFFLKHVSYEVFQVLIVLCINLFFSSWVVIDAFNQSKSNFKYTAYARIASTVLAILARGVMVYADFSFQWIVWSFVAEQLICLILCLLFSKGLMNAFADFSLSGFFSVIRRVLKSGIFVMISTVCIIIYFRVSQGIIERKFDKLYLGIYSLAIYLTEVPISLSSILSTLFTPQLTRTISENPEDSLTLASQILKLFVLVSVFSIICLIVVGLMLAGFLNQDYAGFFGVLLKGLIALPIIFAGYIMNIYLLCSKAYKKYLLINLISAIIALCFLFSVAKFVTKDTAIFLYVMSQLIAAILVPLALHQPLRTIMQRFLSSLNRKNFLSDIKPILLQK